MMRFAEKLVALIGGIICIYLGYLLFVKGVSGDASLKVEYDKSKIQLLNAAPGIFFALFGMVILSMGVWQQSHYSEFETVPAIRSDNLHSSISDAKMIQRVLENSGYKITPIEINKIDKNIFFEDLKNNESKLIYFAGHGFKVETPNNLIPSDKPSKKSN